MIPTKKIARDFLESCLICAINEISMVHFSAKREPQPIRAKCFLLEKLFDRNNSWIIPSHFKTSKIFFPMSSKVLR